MIDIETRYKISKEERELRLRTLYDWREGIKKGVYHFIPFAPLFPKWAKYVPGWGRGDYMGITAPTNVGKSQLMRHMFLKHPYNFSKSPMGSSLDIDFVFLSLEESKDEFIDNNNSAQLYKEYKKSFARNDLLSMTDNMLGDDDFEKLRSVDNSLNSFYDKINVISGEQKVTKLISICKEFADKWGDRDEKGNYIPHNPNQFVILVLDHINCVKGDSNENLHSAMQRLSDFLRYKACKEWNWSCLVVLQQSFAGSTPTFNQYGEAVIAKVKPSLHNAGDNKLILREFHTIYGLFSPHHHSIPTYNGVDIGLLKDHYRSLETLKYRYGPKSIETNLFMDGKTNNIFELPYLKEKSDYETLMREYL